MLTRYLAAWRMRSSLQRKCSLCESIRVLLKFKTITYTLSKPCVFIARNALMPLVTLLPVISVNRGPLVLADTLIIALTWIKLFHNVSTVNITSVGHRLTLTDVFLRDGES